MNEREALKLVEQNGIMLESARGKTSSLVAQIAGGVISENWWSHPKSHLISALTRTVREAEQVLVCRLLQGKITYVHRRLWAALVKVAEDLPPSSLASVRELHGAKGRHEVVETQFPDWVPEEVVAEAKRMSREGALRLLEGRIPGIE